MMGSKLIAGLALTVSLGLAGGAAAQTPATPERPMKTGVEARAMGSASQRAALRAEARAMPAPRPSKTAVRGAAAARSSAPAAARSPLAVTLEAGPAVPSRAALATRASEGVAKRPSQAVRMTERASSLDGVIPTLFVPNPARAAGKEGNGGAKH